MESKVMIGKISGIAAGIMAVISVFVPIEAMRGMPNVNVSLMDAFKEYSEARMAVLALIAAAVIALAGVLMEKNRLLLFSFILILVPFIIFLNDLSTDHSVQAASGFYLIVVAGILAAIGGIVGNQ